MTKKYSRLSPVQRYQLAALLKAGHSNCFIAKQLKVHKSTIGRELKRNSNSQQKYAPGLAQQFANDRQKDKSYFSLFQPK